MDSSGRFKDVELKVGAEVGGHGCLFDITLPTMSVNSTFHSGIATNPSVGDVMTVLNQVFRDYNMSFRIVKNFKQIEEA